MKMRVFLFFVFFAACFLTGTGIAQLKFDSVRFSLSFNEVHWVRWDPGQHESGIHAGGYDHLLIVDSSVSNSNNIRLFGRRGDTSYSLFFFFDTSSTIIHSFRYHEWGFHDYGNGKVTFSDSIYTNNIPVSKSQNHFTVDFRGITTLSLFYYYSHLSGPTDINLEDTVHLEGLDPSMSMITFYFSGAGSGIPSDSKSILELSIFPNPVANVLNIINIPHNASEYILIKDVLGRTKLKQRIDGNEDLSIDVHTLVSGVYWVEVNGILRKLNVAH